MKLALRPKKLKSSEHLNVHQAKIYLSNIDPYFIVIVT